MNSFVMNGYFWQVLDVDPASELLVDRTGTLTVATTDPSTLHVYLSRNLYGRMRERVLLHELGHVTMFSFGLLSDLHRMVRPECWIEAEEWVCNFIADYGFRIFEIAGDVLGVEPVRLSA